MNPTILLNTPRSTDAPWVQEDSFQRATTRPRAETSLDLLAKFVLMRGMAPTRASVISLGTVALLSDSCPSADKAAKSLWEPVLAR